ncbi:MAG: hypothetical protein UY86_C0005G0032, partial [Candidatus Adlerbacteria bacterium GW2011_GWB1_54_7]
GKNQSAILASAKSLHILNSEQVTSGAPGRIRTSVAIKAPRLQRGVIDRSTTDAHPHRIQYFRFTGKNTVYYKSMAYRTILYTLAGALLVLMPIIVEAQTGGLVPCLGVFDCNLCTLGKLTQNVINFLIAVSIPISVALFAWAGWLYFSSAANPGQIDSAKKIFTSVFIGFLIAVGAWLGVQTMLKTLLKDGYYRSWDDIQCVTDVGKTAGRRQSGFTVGEWLNKVLNPLRQANLGVTYAPNCPSDYPIRQTETGQCCTDRNYTSCIQGPTGATPPGISGFTYQSGIDRQLGAASAELNNLISCMGSRVGGQISSISDSYIVDGRNTWDQCRAGQCQHTAGSCHYGGRNCGDQSYAVDLVGDNNALKDAARQCGANFVLDEGNHVHASVGAACGCN